MEIIEVDRRQEVVRGAVGRVLEAIGVFSKAEAGIRCSCRVGKGGFARRRGQERAVGGMLGGHARIGSNPKHANTISVCFLVSPIWLQITPLFRQVQRPRAERNLVLVADGLPPAPKARLAVCGRRSWSRRHGGIAGVSQLVVAVTRRPLEFATDASF